MNDGPAIEVADVVHRYGDRTALAGLQLSVASGEIFALLGPNGCGKTTFFRLISTLIPAQQGVLRVLGYDVRRQSLEVRRRIGVVFQAPSLDRKLTVAENLRHQGWLYGLSGRSLRARQERLLARFGLSDRRDELVETLSGGLRRRVELAKGLLHSPQVLLLDEPTAGLDPAARADLWEFLEQLRREEGMTVVLTTHLLDEADKADRLAILNAGQVVALDTSARLRASVGGDVLTIQTADPGALASEISARFECRAQVVDGQVRLDQTNGRQLAPQLMDVYQDRIQSMTLGHPTLEDVFIARTGHRFWRQREAGRD